MTAIHPAPRRCDQGRDTTDRMLMSRDGEEKNQAVETLAD